MTKNEKIKQILDQQINTLTEKLESTSFDDLFKAAYKELEETYFMSDTEATQEELKEEAKACIRLIEEDVVFQNGIKALVGLKLSLADEGIKNKLKENILNAFLVAKKHIDENQINYKLRILFLEYDYDYQAYLCGFGGGKEYPILEEPDYIDFDYDRELFNGVGIVDYSIGMQAISIVKESWTQDQREIMTNEEHVGIYFMEVKELFLLRTCRILHDAFEEVKTELKNIGLPMEEEVFIYTNEHDCEATNIYVLN